jgi:hypothetical protein
MLKNILTTVVATTIALSGFAQKNDGSTKSLVNTEKDFAASVLKKLTSIMQQLMRLPLHQTRLMPGSIMQKQEIPKD